MLVAAKEYLRFVPPSASTLVIDPSARGGAPWTARSANVCDGDGPAEMNAQGARKAGAEYSTVPRTP
jgi:hypothetical protein